ncbi:beta-lactamase [Legionella rubrilucens]|uniref:Beta-lactamase n=2 Tax=Legionella rubrilucens TaxID=458 RepID=A0A0W0XQ06_9GAMM|nr:beta-lactamase [Legionella rubrilucens]
MLKVSGLKKLRLLSLIQGMVMMTSTLAGSGRGDFHVLYQGQSVDDLIIQYMAEHHIPGMSLAIVQAPYITRVVGYGLANTDSKRLVATHSVFPIGQITNAYTAVAIMQLKEMGKLQLDDALSSHLKDIPSSWQGITLRQLITHSSGLPDYRESSGFDYSKEYTPAQWLDLIKSTPMLFKPGTQSRASATNNYLLGLVIEKASGMTYQEFVSKNQIERMALKHTFFVGGEKTIDNEVKDDTAGFKHQQFLKNRVYINPIEPVTGYEQTEQKLSPSKPLSWTATFADSGIIASAEDISLWDIGLAGGILVQDPADREFLYHPVTVNGQTIPGNAGWLFPGHPGFMEIKGHLPGYSSFLSRFTAPTELVCVTLLANKGGLPDLDGLGRKIAGAFDDKLAAPVGAVWSETLQSPYSVSETMNRVAAIIKKQGGTVFARIDHSGEAEKAGQSLPETQVLIIGNPAKGTALMQANAAFALDLPLRIMATQDEKKQVWLSFTDPVKLASQYHVTPEQLPVLKPMSLGLNRICQQAVSATTIPASP